MSGNDPIWLWDIPDHGELHAYFAVRAFQLLLVIPILGLARYIENTPVIITSAAMLVYIPLTLTSIIHPIYRRTMTMEFIFLAMWGYLAFVAAPAEGGVVGKVIPILCMYLMLLGVVALGIEYYLRRQFILAFSGIADAIIEALGNSHRRGQARDYGRNYGT